MPEVPTPDEGLTFAQIAELRTGDAEAGAEFAKEWAALDTRYLGNSVHPGHTRLKEDTDRPARAQVWIRVNGDLGDDPDLHIAAFTYASDLTLLGAALVPHDVEIGSPEADAGLARPHDLVPPAVPGRPSGGSTTSGRRRPAARAGSRSRGSSPRTAGWSRRWPRRA